MSDYECPACGGGFPATDAADDAVAHLSKVVSTHPPTEKRIERLRS